MKVNIDLYMREKNSKSSYELFHDEVVELDGINITNLDNAKLIVINYIKDIDFDIEDYKLQVYEKEHIKIINVYFDYDKSIDRHVKLNKILR